MAPARIAIAQAGEDVDDRALPFRAFQLGRPGIRLVAVHVLQQLVAVLAAQPRFDLVRAPLRDRERPLRRQPGVHHGPAQRPIHVQQWALPQPLEQILAIRCEQDGLQVGIDLALLVFPALRDGQQGEVVVAQHHDAVEIERPDQTQGFERLATAVDQIAAEPEVVRRRIEAQPLQQPLQRVVAALQVADGVGGHQCKVRGIDSVKAGIGASNRVPSSATQA
jgi:hypothetical protein